MTGMIATAVLAAFALGGAVAAQEPAPRTQAPAAPTEAAKAEAARLLAEAGAAEFFEDASEGPEPGVRHLRSGLVCRFTPGAEANRIHVFQTSPPRGDDVGCTTAADDITLTLYASRYPTAPGAEELMGSAVAAIRQRWPDARPFTGQAANAGIDAKQLPPGSGEHLRERWAITVEGQALLTKVSLIQIGPWTFKQRATGPVDGSIDLHSELIFVRALLDLPDRPN